MSSFYVRANEQTTASAAIACTICYVAPCVNSNMNASSASTHGHVVSRFLMRGTVRSELEVMEIMELEPAKLLGVVIHTCIDKLIMPRKGEPVAQR
jgi:hypothetical protein